MPEHTRRDALPRARVGAAVAVLAALAVALSGAPAASASQGSVPAEVAAYAADPKGLISRLDDLFGIGSGGVGIDFNDTTTVGQLNRVFTFTEAFVAGVATDTPVERQNLWTAPITVNDYAIGVAIIWINPASVAPELADFLRTPDLARSVADVPADAYLVRDEQRAAWFTLAADELTPLAAGSSGVSGVLPLDDFQRSMIDRGSETVDAGGSNTGLATSVVVIAAAAVGVALILLVPVLLARRTNRLARAAPAVESEPELEPEPAPEPAPEPEPEPEPEPVPEPKSKPEPKSTAARKPRAPRRPATPPEA